MSAHELTGLAHYLLPAFAYLLTIVRRIGSLSFPPPDLLPMVAGLAPCGQRFRLRTCAIPFLGAPSVFSSNTKD